MSGRYQRGSLRLEGRRWILRRRVDGREQRIEVGPLSSLKTKGAARLEADAKLEALNAGARAQGERKTLRQYAEFYLEQICGRKKANTRASYRSAFTQYFLPLLGSKQLADIGLREFTTLASELRRRDRAPRSVRAICAILASALRRAREHGYAAQNISLASLQLGADRSIEKPRRILSLEQVQTILVAAGYPWRTFYALLAFAGLRTGEALAMTWGAIDPAGRRIVVRQAASGGIVQTAKSRSSEAAIDMSAELAAELERYRAHLVEQFPPDLLGDHDRLKAAALLFPSPRGPDLPYWSSAIRETHFSPLLRDLGIEHAGLHSFRHFFVTQLLMSNTPPTVVKELARHSDIKITMSYSHVTRDDQRRAIDVLGAAIGPGPCTANG